MSREPVPILFETGPPHDRPASFTRFVLPFAWKKSPCKGVTSGPHFVADVSDLRRPARRRYFSPETSLVLFERARWLRVEQWIDEPRPVNVGDRQISLRIAPPRAVLFEAEGKDHPSAELSTGFLMIDVSFASEATLDDLLAVNELLRYWREPFEGHRERLRPSPGGAFSHNELARLLGTTGAALYFGGWQEILQLPVMEEAGVWQLVSEVDCGEARAWIEDPGLSSAGWICYTDDRAFVYTCALTAHGARDLGRDGEAPEESGDWVRLVNVDFPGTDVATGFERKWVADRTYDRWKHYGTLYGFSTHSAAMLGAPCEEPPTWKHFADMYFDQVLLLLYLRVTTFRFSGKLSRISDKMASGRRDAEAARKPFASLRQAFAFFTNLYRFPLLSSQQQGIELYTLARQALDVDELFAEVQKEIESTHEFFELMTAAGQQRASNRLAWIATVATAAGISLTYLGLDRAKASVKSLQSWIDGWWLATTPPDAWWLIAAGPAALVLLTAAGQFIRSRWASRDSIVDQHTPARSRR